MENRRIEGEQMKFDAFDEKMRGYEKALDQVIDADVYMIARIDGRHFSKLTKEIYDFEAPFDIRFREYMIETVKHLMQCGFKVIFGYTESDEISLLFHKDEKLFGRKVRKYNSILAGEASAKFSLQLGGLACFDCRIIPLPNKELVKDYFLWRQEDASRNALNAHCYWLLRKQGQTPLQATEVIDGKSIEYKKTLLLKNGVDYNKVPLWQKRGLGLYWDTIIKEGYNPITKQIEKAERRALRVNEELPTGSEYSKLIHKLLEC